MLGNIGMAGSVNDQGCAMWAPDGLNENQSVRLNIELVIAGFLWDLS